MYATEFLITKEYRRFEEFCNACFREKYIGLCHGVPGVGKTLSAKHYTQFDKLEKFKQRGISKEEKLALAHQVMTNQTIFYTATVTNTPNRVDAAIKDERFYLFKTRLEAANIIDANASYDEDFGTLIIIDEADRLTMRSLEQVRDIYDRLDGIGVVLIGMPGIEKRLARYAQLYSRVGFLHQFRAIGAEEMKFILERHWAKLDLGLNQDLFSDSEAIATIARITNGNFRLVHRLFSQIKRIVKINQLSSISKEVVEAARKCMVIGQG